MFVVIVVIPNCHYRCYTKNSKHHFFFRVGRALRSLLRQHRGAEQTPRPWVAAEPEAKYS